MSMKVLAVDDERLALNALCRAVKSVVPDCELRDFTDPEEALDEVCKNGFRPDLVFLDIEMFGISGIEMAKKLKECDSAMEIVFVTGFSQYALDAFAVHARGYIMKPVTTISVREEIDNIGKKDDKPDDRLRVQCFGNFEVFSKKGEPLHFERSRTKELFAYLISKNGTSCTNAELCAILWDDDDDTRTQQSYLRHLVADLVSTLKEAGAENVLRRSRGVLAVDTAELNCDYYNFMEGDVRAINSYYGEFMSQYSWPEFTIGYLDSHMQKVKNKKVKNV